MVGQFSTDDFEVSIMGRQVLPATVFSWIMDALKKSAARLPFNIGSRVHILVTITPIYPKTVSDTVIVFDPQEGTLDNLMSGYFISESDLGELRNLIDCNMVIDEPCERALQLIEKVKARK